MKGARGRARRFPALQTGPGRERGERTSEAKGSKPKEREDAQRKSIEDAARLPRGCARTREDTRGRVDERTALVELGKIRHTTRPLFIATNRELTLNIERLLPRLDYDFRCCVALFLKLFDALVQAVRFAHLHQDIFLRSCTVAAVRWPTDAPFSVAVATFAC